MEAQMRLCSRTLLFAFVMFSGLACAQPPGTRADGLSLEEILMRLQIHHWEYERTVPEFFADEWAVSEVHGTQIPRLQTVSESVFRLRRGERDIFPPELIETRTVLRSNGVAVNGSALKGPSILIGAFSNGLAMVTLQERLCFNFRIAHHGDVHHAPTFTIEYEMKPNASEIPGCLPWPGARGEAVIDANTFDTLRFQMHVPRYPEVPGIEGPWRWNVDFAPVVLDGKRYFMPKKITSNAESMDGRIVWSFSASYRNYHKTDVHTRIITSLDDADASSGSQKKDKP
jgi:hypothetical protein